MANMNTKEDAELFSMAFNSGIAVVTQIMQGREGFDLQAIIRASRNTAMHNLGKLLDKPEEDVALFLAPYIKPLEDMIDKTIKEFDD